MPKQNISWRERFSFRQQYWVTEDRRWVRALTAIFMSLFCIYSGGVIIYLFYFSGHISDTPPFTKLISMVAWGYLIAAIPIGLVFYRNTLLRKYERIILTFFVMLSSMRLLLSGMILLKPYA